MNESIPCTPLESLAVRVPRDRPRGRAGAGAAVRHACAARLLLAAALFATIPSPALGAAVRDVPGFTTNTLAANDDGSTGLVPLGFTVDFFGVGYASLYVNNNGNVTFDSPLSTFTPFDLSSTSRVIVAPFFADVDTTVAAVVEYGQDTVDGRAAFGVNWPGVGCFSGIGTVLNDFQLVLIDRSDVAIGDFDIEFNYDSIVWEAGIASGGDATCLGGSPARAGYSNGTGDPGTFFEIAGSGVNGAFLDSNLDSGLIHNSLNSAQSGRYVFQVRGGQPLCQSDGECEDGHACTLDSCLPGDPEADARGCVNEIAGPETVCRPSEDVCDAEETCDGLLADCPDDVIAADGTSCDDSVYCNGADSCSSGVCVHAGDPCSGDGCVSCDEEADSCTFEPAGTACEDDSDDCTRDACDGAGTCEHDPIPLAEVCNWAIVGGSDTVAAKVKIRQAADVGGGICTDRADIGAGSVLRGDGSWALLHDSGTAAKVRASATLESGDAVSAGGCMKGVKGVQVLGSGALKVCCAESPATLPGGGVADACGVSPRLAECGTAKSQVAADIALLDSLGATQTPGRLSCTLAEPCVLTATGDVNVIDTERIQIANDGVLTLDAAGNPDAVFVVRTAAGIRGKLRTSVLLAGGAQARNVAFYAPSGSCQFGDHSSGSGTLFCPDGKVRMKQGSTWNGGVLSGRTVDLGDNVVLTHVPFLGLAD